MNIAIKCIEGLEKSVEEKEKIYSILLSKNVQLRHRLGNLKEGDIEKQDNLLYRCDHCPSVQTDFRNAFRHESLVHGSSEAEYNVRGLRQPVRDTNVRKDGRSWRKRSLSELPLDADEYRCRQCQTTAHDKTLLHLHSLLHKELIYLQCPWPRCELVFGVPSKLKTHHFLAHEMVLAAEEKCTIDINARVLLTR